MRIIREQSFLFILLCLTVTAIFGIGLMGALNRRALQSAHESAAHSDDVLDASGEAKRAFTAADLRGRLELVGMTNGTDKTGMRTDALNKIETLRVLVADNREQIANVSEIQSAIENRFKVQDATANLAQRGDGNISTPAAQTSLSIESVQRAETAFNGFNVAEYSLLRDRLEELSGKESRFTLLVLFLIGISLFVLCVFAYCWNDTIRFVGKISRDVDKIVEKSEPDVDDGFVRVPRETMNKLRNRMLEASDGEE